MIVLNYILFNVVYCVFNVCMVDFGGWDMFVNYGLQIEEYVVVCIDVGMFDVLYMCVVDFIGSCVCVFFEYVIVNNVGKFKMFGKVFYLCLFNL